MLDAEKIRKRIREKGYTMSEYASVMGIHRVTLSRKIHGDLPIFAHEIQQLIIDLDIKNPIEYFFTDAVNQQVTTSKLLECKTDRIKLLFYIESLGETLNDLAKLMGISPAILEAKIDNGTFGAAQVICIAKHYNMSANDIEEIFYHD